MDKETIVYAETEIFHPVIQREVLICVWELLYEWGREMSPEEFKELQKKENQLQMSSKSKELLTAHMLEVICPTLIQNHSHLFIHHYCSCYYYK